MNLIKDKLLAQKCKSDLFIEYNRGIKKFTLNNGVTFLFPLAVYSKVELKDKILIGYSYGDLKDLSEKIEYWRAVFAYDFKGNVLWQVEAPYYIDLNTGNREDYNPKWNGTWKGDAIQGVRWFDDEQKFLVYGRLGYELDPKTGKISNHFYLR
jgi:hypothetical protein